MDSRPNTMQRGISSSLARLLSPPVSPFKAYVDSTASLSAAQWNVARAYLCVFGRSPDTSGLNYWAGLSSAGTFANACNALLASANSITAVDPAASVLSAQLYVNLLGRSGVEDPAGIAYWATQITNTSYGEVCAQVLGILATATGFTGDLVRHRLYTLESVCRLQIAYSRDLNTDDSRTAVVRVEDSTTYDEAMADIYTLLVTGAASPTNAFDKTWTSITLNTAARTTDNSTIKHARNIVWFNRAGRMMRAAVYLPATFTTGTHRALILWHGGGWRLGWPEQVEWLANAMAGSTGQSYVVICPSYRLTPFGTVSPGQQQDAQDILALVKANSSVLRCDSVKVGLMGESSGGHLASLVGSTQDAWRVHAMYPPIDLRGSPAVSTGLDPYVNYYASTSTLKSNASPQVQWTSARTTLFKLWHGDADTFVPSSQSINFQTLAGSKCTVQIVSGEGHGFSSTTQASYVTDAKSWFALT